LGKVRAELEPTDWKPFDDVGAGTREIPIREATGVYRVMYVAKFWACNWHFERALSQRYG
jgi:phage-related protein